MSKIPTLNQSYNELLKKWGSEPECEECGYNLTGKKVVELSWGWVCTDCANNEHGGDFSDEYYRQAERRQMGLDH